MALLSGKIRYLCLLDDLSGFQRLVLLVDVILADEDMVGI